MDNEIKLPSRNDLNVKYLISHSSNYKISRNAMIQEYRKYRSKMSGLINTLDLMYIYTKLDHKDLTNLQSSCTKAISEEFAKSTKENRYNVYVGCIDIMSKFIYSTGTLAKEPIAKNELKILRMMAGYMFFKASECIDELNIRN